MLYYLSVNDFVISQNLELEINKGMTVISGETGAGKSIMIDALGLALGDRADNTMIRQGTERSDIHASFDISDLPIAQQWLQERDLLSDHECLLRRVITKEGRSRAYINGKPSTLSDLKAIGRELIDIHSQHEHQSLLNKEQQRQLLDAYGELTSLANTVKQQATRYLQITDQLNEQTAQQLEQQAKLQLLRYQIEELSALELTDNELAELETEQQQLTHGSQLLQACQQSLALCSEGEVNISNLLFQAKQALENQHNTVLSLSNASELLSSAIIQVEEASRDIEHFIDTVDLSPERLNQVEKRLDSIYSVARKNRVKAEQLPTLLEQLQQELTAIEHFDESLLALEQMQQQALKDYYEQANKLSKARLTTCKTLSKKVNEQLHHLAMKNCRFEAMLIPQKENSISKHGNESIAFYVSTNPGQPPQALAKVASGGELSRISLAIQVVIAQSCKIPTLVFDEVDVGIGGATAETVGLLLRQLGEQGQVLCVTHQPQVASKGHQHLLVSKHASGKYTYTDIKVLNKTEQVSEIARMLGGIEITEQTLAHAEEMLTLTH